MRFKIGEVVYVRTTEEPCLAVAERKLSIGDTRFPKEYAGSGLIIVVQRPIIADGGVARYEFYDFLEEALATSAELTAMRIQRLRDGQELYREEIGGPEGPAGPALVKN
jgi:hypothetical protein